MASKEPAVHEIRAAIWEGLRRIDAMGDENCQNLPSLVNGTARILVEQFPSMASTELAAPAIRAAAREIIGIVRDAGTVAATDPAGMGEHLRGTGRTTRMLRSGIRHGLIGNQVFVIGIDENHCDRLRQEAVKILGEDERLNGQWSLMVSRNLIEFGSDGHLHFFPWQKIRFDWDRMNTGVHGPDAVFLVDHHAIEAKFRPVLDMLHRWDHDSPPSTSTDTASASIGDGEGVAGAGS